MRGLFAVVMLTGIYSFLSACWMTILDAPDVAFTEAAVGAGISTVLMLGTLALTTTREKVRERSQLLPLLVVAVTGAVLIYGTLEMPAFGDGNAPANVYPDPSFIERSEKDIELPNIVTAILASYRGYDTLGETCVIFTAGVGVLLMLRRRKRKENA